MWSAMPTASVLPFHRGVRVRASEWFTRDLRSAGGLVIGEVPEATGEVAPVKRVEQCSTRAGQRTAGCGARSLDPTWSRGLHRSRFSCRWTHQKTRAVRALDDRVRAITREREATPVLARLSLARTRVACTEGNWPPRGARRRLDRARAP